LRQARNGEAVIIESDTTVPLEYWVPASEERRYEVRVVYESKGSRGTRVERYAHYSAGRRSQRDGRGGDGIPAWAWTWRGRSGVFAR